MKHLEYINSTDLPSRFLRAAFTWTMCNSRRDKALESGRFVPTWGLHYIYFEYATAAIINNFTQGVQHGLFTPETDSLKFFLLPLPPALAPCSVDYIYPIIVLFGMAHMVYGGEEVPKGDLGAHRQAVAALFLKHADYLLTEWSRWGNIWATQEMETAWRRNPTAKREYKPAEW